MNQLKAFFVRGALLGILPSMCLFSQDTSLEKNFELLDQWVSTEKTLSLEKNDWELQKQGLLDVISVYEKELEMLDEKIADAQEFTSAVDTKKSSLLEEQEGLKTVEAELDTLITAQEQHLQKIIKRIPTCISQEIAPLSQRIPTDPKNTTLSLSQRLQSIVGILTQIDKFNTTVEVVPEQREFTDGLLIQVKTIYFGLGAAYFVDQSGEHAGYGKPTDAGWDWVEDPSLAVDVARMIQMYDGSTTGIEFVPVPIQINQ